MKTSKLIDLTSKYVNFIILIFIYLYGILNSYRVYISVLSIMIIAFYFGFQQHNLISDGCDPFGYARQERLFRQNGLIDGLRTAINTNEAHDLITIGKSLADNTRSWGVGIAPHCHHYNDITDSIILQYPPGTGFILSLFPEKQSLAYAYLLGLALTTYVFIQICLANNFIANLSLANIIVFYATIWIASYPASFGSTSVPISILLIIPAAYYCYMAFHYHSNRCGYRYAIIFGILSGLLFAVRIPNALILIGFTIYILLENRFWNYKEFSSQFIKILCGFTFFMIFGGSAVILANKMNAGGYLNTTYSSDDASAPLLSLNLIYEKLLYFFYDSYCSPLIWLACFTYILTIIYYIFINPKDSDISTLVSTGLLFLLSLAFFATHQISAPYYMLPTSVAVMGMCLVSINHSGGTETHLPHNSLGKYLLFALCLIFLSLRIATFQDFSLLVTMPRELIDSKSIFWADPTTGVINYYFNKYSAKLYAVSEELHDDLISSVFRIGYRQFLVSDSARLEAILHKQMQKYPVYEVGALQSYYFNFPIWEINSKNLDSIVNLDNQLIATEDDHIYSAEEINNVSIKLNMVEDTQEYKVVHLKLFNGNNFILRAHSSIGSPIRITWRPLDSNGKSLNNWGMRKDILFDIAPKSEGNIKIFIDKTSLSQAKSLDISLLQEWHLKAYETGGSKINVTF